MLTFWCELFGTSNISSITEEQPKNLDLFRSENQFLFKPLLCCRASQEDVYLFLLESGQCSGINTIPSPDFLPEWQPWELLICYQWYFSSSKMGMSALQTYQTRCTGSRSKKVRKLHIGLGWHQIWYIFVFWFQEKLVAKIWTFCYFVWKPPPSRIWIHTDGCWWKWIRKVYFDWQVTNVTYHD